MLFRIVSAGLFALAILSYTQAQDSNPPPVRTFLDLEAYASQLAQKPYVPPPAKLDPFFDRLNYDQHRKIRWKSDMAIFKGPAIPFEVEFFHPGWMFKKTVSY